MLLNQPTSKSMPVNNTYWEKLGIPIIPIHKKFYSKYFYKIGLHLPYSGDVIHPYKKGIVGDRLLLDIHKRRLWRDRMENRSLHIFERKSDYQTDLLLSFANFLTTQNKPKIRVEEPIVDFYFETEESAMAFVDAMPADVKGTIASVFAPVTEQTKKILADGYVILQKPAEYRYLVTIREGRYQFTDTTKLLDYLLSVDAKVSALLQSKLRGEHFNNHLKGRLYGRAWTPAIDGSSAYFSGIRFYLKNEADVSWLHLLWPSRIGKIQEVRYAGVNTDKE